MSRVPLSVIGGYLGAGKTTLINHLLGMDHGATLAVLVNDFGAINIDAALLRSSSEDTIELTNGCICCTMSGDLFFTIGDLLDRTPRPDHILVEASGIADPARIAAVALAEKDLRYSGIVTIVDGANIDDQLSDPRISDQIRGQIRAADLVAVSKCDPATVAPTLKGAGITHRVSASDLPAITATLFGSAHLPTRPTPGTAPHPTYVQWSDPAPRSLSRDDLTARLSHLPSGLLRLKALLPNPEGGGWEVHVVGRQTEVLASQNPKTPGLVAIGLAASLGADDIRRWWQGAT